MSRYDGLIIPRSYSEYINKTDAATLSQALQLSGVMDAAPTANSNHPTKSGGVYTALAGKQATLTFDDTPTENSNNPVKSGGVYSNCTPYVYKRSATATSFVNLTGQGNVNGAAIADYIKTYITNYNNGDIISKDLGGPSYQGTLYKFSNSYFSVMFCGYATNGGLEIYTYTNGTYVYKKIG